MIKKVSNYIDVASWATNEDYFKLTMNLLIILLFYRPKKL